jgi:hypothetical protein
MMGASDRHGMATDFAHVRGDIGAQVHRPTDGRIKAARYGPVGWLRKVGIYRHHSTRCALRRSLHVPANDARSMLGAPRMDSSEWRWR